MTSNDIPKLSIDLSPEDAEKIQAWISENIAKIPQYPFEDMNGTVLGPDVIVTADRSIINYAGENYYTKAALQQFIPIAQPTKLSDYREDEPVEVMRAGVWRLGHITSRDSISGHLHVHTELGPVTIASTGRIRRPQIPVDED